MSFDFRMGEHVLICGRTGTGKTFALKEILKKRVKDNFIIFDYKKQDFQNLGFIVKNFREFILALKNKKTKIIIQDELFFSPDTKVLYDTLEKYTNFIFHNIKNVVVVVDELHNFCQKMFMPSGLKKIVTMGRSFRISFFGASQRTQTIHNNFISETTHKFIFRLELESDRNLILKMMDTKKNFDELKDFEFFYKYKYQNVEIHKF